MNFICISSNIMSRAYRQEDCILSAERLEIRQVEAPTDRLSHAGHMNRDFLGTGNHKKIIHVFSSILEPHEINKISDEAKGHTRLMYELGVGHFRFAKSIPKIQWRQRVSRLYYASYNVSKCVRFDSDGNFSTEVKDHNKIGALPNDFPEKSTFENELKNLREDRNSADYDHLATRADLLSSPDVYEALVLKFIRHAHDHLTARGNNLGVKL